MSAGFHFMYYLSPMRTSLFLLICLFSLSIYGQQTRQEKPFKSKAGAVFKLKGGALLHGMYSSSDQQRMLFVHAIPSGKGLTKAQSENGAFCKTLLNSKVLIEQFDAKLNSLQTGNLKFPKSAGDRNPVFMVSFGERVLVFSALINPANQTISLYGQPIDPKTLALTGKEELVGTSPFPSGTEIPADFYDWALSPDGAYLLILNKRQQGIDDYIGMTALSKDLRTAFRKELIVPLPKGKFQIEKVLFSNDRQVFLLNRSGARAAAHYDLLHFGRGQSAFDLIGVNLPENQAVTDIDICSGYGNRVIVAGFYNDSEKPDVQSGLFWGQIKPGEMRITNYQIHPFDLAFLLANKPEKDRLWLKNRIVDGKARINHYEMDQIHLTADGGCYILGEERNATRAQIWAYVHEADNTPPEDGYKHAEILVFRLDPAGNMEWKKKVSKLQRSSDDEGVFLSYDHFMANDKLYFLFNENSKLLSTSTKGYEGFAKSERAIIALTEMAKDGSSASFKLAGFSSTQTFLRPGMHLGLGENQWLFLTSYNDLSLLKVFPNVSTR